MENTIVGCVQQRMGIMASQEEFEAQARRFLHQAQSKEAQIVIFPELTGLMLAPPLISSLKLGFIKRADQGRQPTSGWIGRARGRVSGAAAGMLGGGFRGSLQRLLDKRSDVLRDTYFETYGNLARESGAVIVGGSVYLYDEETGTIRNRAYIFDRDGEIVGYQDKLNLAPYEREIVSPGSEVSAWDTRYGRLGVLLGRDALYPELARLLAMQGADLIAGISASPGAAQAKMVRQAIAMRAEENQLFAATSFLLGPNYVGPGEGEDLFGRSALLAPISLSLKGDGVLVEAGTDRTEVFIAAELDGEALATLRETSGFRPRQEMNLGSLGPALADFYDRGLNIDQAVAEVVAGPLEPEAVPYLEPVVEEALGETSETPEPSEPFLDSLDLPDPLEAVPDELDIPESVGEAADVGVEELPASVPEALSLTGSWDEEAEKQAD